MSERELPTLDDDLTKGHSRDCKKLSVDYFRDLGEKIDTTIKQVRESALELIDVDIDLADEVDRILGWIPRDMNYAYLISNYLVKIQEAIKSSELSDEEKQRFWQPIAECYAEVRAALQERITPLEERELVKLGDTITVPVKVFRYRSDGRIGMITFLPKFKFALLSQLPGCGDEHRDALISPELEDDYIRRLPMKIRERLVEGKINHLPLKIVSAQYGHFPIARIDEEAFLGMGEDDE